MKERRTITLDEDVDRGLRNYMANLYYGSASRINFSSVINRILKTYLTEEGSMVNEEEVKT